MSEWEHEDTEGAEVEETLEDVAPVPVRVEIVSDSTRGPNKPRNRPAHFDTRRFLAPGASSGPLSQRIAPKNPLRHRIQIFPDGGNVGLIYISDQPIQSANALDSALALSRLAYPIEFQTQHEIYAYGPSQGDILYIAEETFDA